MDMININIADYYAKRRDPVLPNEESEIFWQLTKVSLFCISLLLCLCSCTRGKSVIIAGPAELAYSTVIVDGDRVALLEPTYHEKTIEGCLASFRILYKSETLTIENRGVIIIDYDLTEYKEREIYIVIPSEDLNVNSVMGDKMTNIYNGR